MLKFFSILPLKKLAVIVIIVLVALFGFPIDLNSLIGVI